MDDLVSALRWAAVACLLCCGTAGAASLPDPTRPPETLAPRAGPGLGLPYAALGAGPHLQSVLVAPHAGGRRIAVIDGQMVRLGGSYKGAVLTRVSDTEVVLSRGSARQVLKLFPVAAVPGKAAAPR
jgi:MSHA biogenesis protein MshK